MMQGDRRLVVGRRRGKETQQKRSTVTYPFWVPLETWLVRQNPNSGLTKEKLVSGYLARPGQPEQTVVAPQPGIDVERLSDEEVKELVEKWASGHKILLDRLDKPHVIVHSLTPHLMEGKAEKVLDVEWKCTVPAHLQLWKCTRKSQCKRCTVQVDTFYQINFLCFNVFYAGLKKTGRPQKDGQGPSPTDQEEALADGKKSAEGSEERGEENWS